MLCFISPAALPFYLRWSSASPGRAPTRLSGYAAGIAAQAAA